MEFKPERVTLGIAEATFLSLISTKDESAYGIFTTMKNFRSMAYKNVHRRIKRLQELNLIEKVEGNFKQNAVMYRLTSRGLFEILIMTYPVRPKVDPSVWEKYSSNPILQTILFPYFEPETIRAFEKRALEILAQYLRKCCERILDELEYVQKKGERGALRMLNAMRHEIENFVSYIVTMSAAILWNSGKPTWVDLFPIDALAKDGKFIEIVKTMKANFDNGCKRIFNEGRHLDPKDFFTFSNSYARASI